MREENDRVTADGDVLRPHRALWLLSLGGTIFVAAFALVGRHTNGYIGLYLAAALILLALLFHNIRVGEWRYFVATLLNATAAGCAAGAYFAVLGLPFFLWESGVAWLTVQFLLLVGYIFGYHTKKHPRLFRFLAFFLWLAALAVLIPLWCVRPLEEGLYATLTMTVFYSAFAYPPLFLVWEDEGSSARLVSFFSFTATLLLAVLVLVVIALASGDGCDADCADCCDCDGLDGKKKKKR